MAAPTYTAHNWQDGEVITAERLNAIENQLAALSAAGAIATANLADGAVTSAKIGASAVGSGKIGANAVGTSNIANGAVTAAKIASGVIPAAPTVDNLSGATATGRAVMKATDAEAARTAIGAAAAAAE